MFNGSAQLPTDNLYKFLSISGLLAVILSVWGIVTINTQANREFIEQKLEVFRVKVDSTSSPFDKAKAGLLDREADIRMKDKKIIMNCLSILAGLGVVGMFVGFWMWSKHIQPISDSTARMQLEILSLQAEKLKKENEKIHSSNETSSTEEHDS